MSEETFYQDFCSRIAAAIYKSQINATLFSGPVSALWLKPYLFEEGFYRSLRVLFVRHLSKPFRRLTLDDLSRIDSFLDTLDKYTFLDMLRHGDIHTADLDQLEELIELEHLHETINRNTDVLVEEYSLKRGRLFVTPDYEHEPVHLYIKSQFKSEPSNYYPVNVQVDGDDTTPVALSHLVKIRDVQKYMSSSDAERKHASVVSATKSEVVVFYPDEYSIDEANTKCYVGVPIRQTIMSNIHSDQKVLLTHVANYLHHAKLRVIILPDRSSFQELCYRRRCTPLEQSSRWYDTILQIIVSDLDPQRSVVEFSNAALYSSTIWDIAKNRKDVKLPAQTGYSGEFSRSVEIANAGN